jgi:predicted nucleic acid-binding protein
MIHLDTNCLISLGTNQSPPKPQISAWLNSKEEFAISAIAWSEFLNGPVTLQQVQDALGMVEDRIIPFGMAEAEVASKLFNRNGRKRGSQPDCFIAATAICAATPLATLNRKDFALFLPAGLRLA